MKVNFVRFVLPGSLTTPVSMICESRLISPCPPPVYIKHLSNIHNEEDCFFLCLSEYSWDPLFPVQSGYTALMAAAFYGHIVVVQLLLEAGAAIDIKDIVSCVRGALFLFFEAYVKSCLTYVSGRCSACDTFLSFFPSFCLFGFKSKLIIFFLLFLHCALC